MVDDPMEIDEILRFLEDDRESDPMEIDEILKLLEDGRESDPMEWEQPEDFIPHEVFKEFEQEHCFLPRITGGIGPAKTQISDSCWASVIVALIKFLLHKKGYPHGIEGVSLQELIMRVCSTYPRNLPKLCNCIEDAIVYVSTFGLYSSIHSPTIIDNDYKVYVDKKLRKADPRKVEDRDESFKWLKELEQPLYGVIRVKKDFYKWNFHSVYKDPADMPGKPSKKSDFILHAVLIVGYGWNGSHFYYIIRNSWGDIWGIKGFARISVDCFLDVGFPMNVDTRQVRSDEWINEWIDSCVEVHMGQHERWQNEQQNEQQMARSREEADRRAGSGVELISRCCQNSGTVANILCGLPSSLPVTTVVSGGGDGTIASQVFSILSLCDSSSKETQGEATDSKLKLTDPCILVQHGCLVVAAVAQSLKLSSRNSAIFMLTSSSKKQVSRLAVLARHFTSEERTQSPISPSCSSAMLAFATILSLESGASIETTVAEIAVPRTSTLCEQIKVCQGEGNAANYILSSGMLSFRHGLRDGCLGLLESRLKWGGPLAVRQLCASGIPQVLMDLLLKNHVGFPNFGLSPVGAVWALSIVCQCLPGGISIFRQVLLRKENIKSISDLVSVAHLKLVSCWNGPGRGKDGLRDLINAVVDLLAFPLVAVQSAPGLPAATASVNSGFLLNVGSPGGKVCADDKDMLKEMEANMGKYSQLLLEVAVPGIILRCVDQMDLKHVAKLVAFLAKMAGHRPLSLQLLGASLLDPGRMRKLLGSSCPGQVTVDVLTMISDLARMDKAGANPNFQCYQVGYTPLDHAALLGRREVVEILFPLTSPIASYPDWSVNGIMQHAKSWEAGMLDHESVIIYCGNEFFDSALGDHEAGVILESTSFYAEPGGQIYDTGVLEGPSGLFQVNDVQVFGGFVVHIGSFNDKAGRFCVGDQIICKVDYNRLAQVAPNHTCTHMSNRAPRLLPRYHAHHLADYKRGVCDLNRFLFPRDHGDTPGLHGRLPRSAPLQVPTDCHSHIWLSQICHL